MNNDKIYFSITQSSIKNVESPLSNTKNDSIVNNFHIRVIYNKKDKYKNDILYLLNEYYKKFISLDCAQYNNYISIYEYQNIHTCSLFKISLCTISYLIKYPKEFKQTFVSYSNIIIEKIKYYISDTRSIKKLHNYKNIQDLENKCSDVYNFLTNISNIKLKRLIKSINKKFVYYSDEYISELLNIFNNIKDYINLSVDIIVTNNINYEKGIDFTNLYGDNIDEEKVIKRIKYQNSSFNSILFFKSNYNIEDISILEYIFSSSNFLRGNYNIIFDVQIFGKDLYLYINIKENVEDFIKYIKDYYNNHLDNLIMPLSSDSLKFNVGILDEIYYNLYKKSGIINNDYNYRQYLSQYKYGDIKEILDNIFNNLDKLNYIEVYSNEDNFNKFINNNKELLKDFKIKE